MSVWFQPYFPLQSQVCGLTCLDYHFLRVDSHLTVMKLREIAGKLGVRLEPSNADAEITGIAAIETAGAGEITFVVNPKYAPLAKTTRASAVIVEENFPPLDIPTLRARNPQYVYLR